MEVRTTAPPKPAGLVVLDASYTYEMINERGLHDAVRCRDLNGYFRHVWSVHPFATLLTSPNWAPRFGKPVWHVVDDRHTFIEGKVGRTKALARFFPLNFLLGQLGLFITLVRLIRREKIAAVRAGDPLYLGLFGWTLSRVTGVPFVIRVNGNNDNIRANTGEPMLPRLFRSIRIEKIVERFVLPRAKWIFAPNKNNLQFAVANGAPPRCGSVISFGSLLDHRHFAPVAMRGDGDADLHELCLESRKFILCIGRLEPPKFPDHVLLVLEQLRNHGLDLSLVFVGDGSMRSDLQRMTSERRLSEYVSFAGNRDQGWLSRVIPHVAAVLSPSSGRALSEAALGEAPIIAYDTDWQGDLIETGHTGMLVPYRDWKAMAKATRQVIDDPDLARAYGRAVRDRALEMLDPVRAVAEERRVYESFILPHRRGSAEERTGKW